MKSELYPSEAICAHQMITLGLWAIRSFQPAVRTYLEQQQRLETARLTSTAAELRDLGVLRGSRRAAGSALPRARTERSTGRGREAAGLVLGLPGEHQPRAGEGRKPQQKLRYFCNSCPPCVRA